MLVIDAKGEMNAAPQSTWFTSDLAKDLFQTCVTHLISRASDTSHHIQLAAMSASFVVMNRCNLNCWLHFYLSSTKPNSKVLYKCCHIYTHRQTLLKITSNHSHWWHCIRSNLRLRVFDMSSSQEMNSNPDCRTTHSTCWANSIHYVRTQGIAIVYCLESLF